jgi:DNA-binding transcriptional regulator LsrR (DeoR family)
LSAKLLGWALQQEGLEPQEKLLLVILADHFNDKEGAAWAGQARIAKMMGVSDRQVRRLQVSLVEKGILNVEHRTGSSNMYRMVTPDTVSGGVGLTSPGGSDTAVLYNSYRTLNERYSDKFKKTQIPDRYVPPIDDSVDPSTAITYIKDIKKKLRKQA